jgi:hypothetical protein
MISNQSPEPTAVGFSFSIPEPKVFPKYETIPFNYFLRRLRQRAGAKI